MPVSLGIVLDTSGSMEGEKIRAARDALDRLLEELDNPEDEFFLYQFANDSRLLQEWTSDRRAVSRALGRATPRGDTAMYDAIAKPSRWRHGAGTGRRRSSSFRMATTRRA